MTVAQALTPLLRRLAGDPLPIRIEFWDGRSLGPEGVEAAVRFRSPRALHRLVTAPGELGLGRAYVAGEIDLDGSLDAILDLGVRNPDLGLGATGWLEAIRSLRRAGAMPPKRLPPSPEEARLSGRRHSKARDAAAIRHHYDVSNEFYRIVLGPTLTYSSAYFASPDASLEDAQTNKHELICRKLRLQPDERVLDVGCGWGSLAIHAATQHGARVVGVTLSQRQAEPFSFPLVISNGFVQFDCGQRVEEDRFHEYFVRMDSNTCSAGIPTAFPVLIICSSSVASSTRSCSPMASSRRSGRS